MMQEVKNKNFKKNRYNSKEINIFKPMMNKDEYYFFLQLKLIIIQLLFY